MVANLFMILDLLQGVCYSERIVKVSRKRENHEHQLFRKSHHQG
jgi:hypothetical protein